MITIALRNQINCDLLESMPGPGGLGESDSGSDSDDMTLLELQSSAMLRLDNMTDISDSSDAAAADLVAPPAATAEVKGVADAAAARKLAATLVAARKRRQAREPSVADGRAKRIRGMLTSLCTLMKFGNRDLCAADNLYASLIAKPGGLSKQGIMRWSRGLGTGPSFAKVSSVFAAVGAEHLDPVIAYNDEREKFPVTHANQRAKWLGATRRRSDSPAVSPGGSDEDAAAAQPVSRHPLAGIALAR